LELTAKREGLEVEEARQIIWDARRTGIDSSPVSRRFEPLPDEELPF
jgi:hypothetical protein